MKLTINRAIRESRTRLSIGIDASLTGTAIAIINCASGKLVHIETIKSKQWKTSRLLEIRDAVIKAIAPRVPFIAQVFYEGYAYGFGSKSKDGFGRQSSSITGLAELRGVLTTMLTEEFHTPIFFVAPPTLKKFITGKGVGEKNMVILHAYKKWKREFADDNECDAFGLAKLGQAFNDPKLATQEYERQCLDTVKESDQSIDDNGN